MILQNRGKVKSFLVIRIQCPHFTQLEVLIKLFQKFAEYEAEPHFNAKASAFATVLQNGEACFDILDRVNTSRM